MSDHSPDVAHSNALAQSDSENKTDNVVLLTNGCDALGNHHRTSADDVTGSEQCPINLDDNVRACDNEGEEPSSKRRKIHMTMDHCFSHVQTEEGKQALSNPLQLSLSSSSKPQHYLTPRTSFKHKHGNHGVSSQPITNQNCEGTATKLLSAFHGGVDGGFKKASNAYNIVCDVAVPGSSTVSQSSKSGNACSKKNQSKMTNFFKGSSLTEDEQAQIDKLYTSTTELYSPLKKVGDSIYISDNSSSPTSSQSQESKTNIKDNPVVKQLFEAQKTMTSDTKPKPRSRFNPKYNQNHLGKKTPVSKVKQRDNDYISSSDDENMCQALEKANTYGLFSGAVREEKIDYFSRLPDEVIEKILCHLPMLDLCLNSNRVCVRWSNIISADKFMPWKKLYHKLKKNVGDSRHEIQKLMRENSMRLPGTYLLSLIRYMKDLKVVHGNTSECLKKHKKYVWAKALLEERVQDCIQHGEPNPWSVMAVLVIISENVDDITEIIQCLSVPLSQCTTQEILECLYCISCFLLAFKLAKQNDVWNGMHYRLFYALYLYENASTSSYGDLKEALGSRGGQQSILKYGDAGTSIRLTHEQKRIVNHNCQPGEIIKIVAFAGTGKTTTLVRYTQLRPHTRFLLVVYNRSVCDYAKTKFPRNVTCMTGHALAYRKVGYKFRNAGKFKGFGPSVYNITQILPSRKGDNLFVRAKFTLDTLNNFLASADPVITDTHVPNERMNDQGEREAVDFNKKRLYAEDAQYLWTRMQDMNNTKVSMSHDGYLKLYQLSRPKLHYDYDCILIDEAQDMTPALSDILLTQRISKILVGDPHQQIYSFRGAVNSMQLVQATTIFYLTQSFRFGPEIAQVAACCLESLKNERKKTLVGNGQKCEVLGEPVGQVAILTRCNFTLFNEAVKQCCYKNSDEKVSFVGGTEGFGFPMLMDIYTLMLSPEQRLKERREIESKLVKSFSNIGDLEKYATKVHDAELMGKIKIVKTHNHNLPVHIHKILSKHTNDQRTADIILSTAHKAKGLEFSTVRLTDDFNVDPLLRQVFQDNPLIGQLFPTVFREANMDESNLLYVAVTRAKHALQMTRTLKTLLSLAGLTYKFPVLSLHLKEKGITFQCISRGVEFKPYALTLHRKEVKLGDGTKSKGGVYSPDILSEDDSSLNQLLGLTPEDIEKAAAKEEQRRH